MKLNTNYLYYFNEKDREKHRIEKILNVLNIQYIPVKVVPRKVDEKFVYLMLEFCANGFDDLIKNPNKTDYGVEDIGEMKTSELVKLIVSDPERFLKPSWFLGMSGGEGVITSRATEDDFTIYRNYYEREMSKIYG